MFYWMQPISYGIIINTTDRKSQNLSEIYNPTFKLTFYCIITRNSATIHTRWVTKTGLNAFDRFTPFLFACSYSKPILQSISSEKKEFVSMCSKLFPFRVIESTRNDPTRESYRHAHKTEISWSAVFWTRIATVEYRYLEIQGTLWNTSRYPYFDISDLRNWLQFIEQPPLTEWICNLTPKLEIYWKYCGKEEKLLLRSNFSSFPQYFVTCCHSFMLKQGPDFHSEISGYSR